MSLSLVNKKIIFEKNHIVSPTLGNKHLVGISQSCNAEVIWYYFIIAVINT